MGHKHTKEEILQGALDVALDDGLSTLTFGRVAKRLNINDRTVVYYFPTKDDLVTEVLVALGLQIQHALGQAFSNKAPDHLALTRAAWPILTEPENISVFGLFLEANGLATAGREPYKTLVTQLVAGWIEWVGEFVDGEPDQQLAEAEAAVALVDGLLLIRILAGEASAERAAKALGVLR